MNGPADGLLRQPPVNRLGTFTLAPLHQRPRPHRDHQGQPEIGRSISHAEGVGMISGNFERVPVNEPALNRKRPRRRRLQAAHVEFFAGENA